MAYMELTSEQKREARIARRRGKRAKHAKVFRGNPYSYTLERHKHDAWASGYLRCGN